MDRIKTQLDSLSTLSDEELSQLQADIVSEFETVEGQTPTTESVDAMTSLADALDTVKGEATQREANAQALTNRAAEASLRVKGPEETASDVAETAGAIDGNPEDPDNDGDVDADGNPVVILVEGDTDAEATDPNDPLADTSAPTSANDPDADSANNPLQENPDDREDFVATEPPVDPAAVPADVAVPDEVTPDDENADTVAPPVKSDDASAAAAPTPDAAPEDTETPVDENAEDPAKKDDQADATATASTETEKAAELSTTITASADAADNSQTSDAPQAQEEQEAQVSSTEVTDPATIEVPADRVAEPAPVVASAAPVAITAGADIQGITAGSTLNDMDEVAKAFTTRLRSVKNVNGGDGEQHIVASIATTYPESRMLTNDVNANWAKIQNVVGPKALAASGGFQSPFTVKYDIFGIGVTDRPVRDSLVTFQADRGGIRYITPPVLSAYSTSAGVWTAANDVALTTPTTKALLQVAAASETTAVTDAITLQLKFGNLVTRAYPELVARHNELALIQHARTAESNLLTAIAAGSTAVTTGTELMGGARDYLVQMGRAAAAYRSRHRLDPVTGLVAIAPAWVRDAMAADLALNMPGDGNLGLALSEVDAYIAARNVKITWTIDGADQFGAQTAAAMLAFPNTFTWYLFAEGTFLFLDGGTLDIGIIRDSTLVGTNDYLMFMESFEKAVKVGVESLAIAANFNVNGVAAALRDSTGGAAAAAIEL